MENMHIQEHRRVPALPRWSPGHRRTARRFNAPVDAINRLAAGVNPARQVVFASGGRSVDDIEVTGPWACFYGQYYAGEQLICEIDADTMAPKPGRILRAPSVNASGVGGDAEVIWHLDNSRKKLWKLDARGRAVLDYTFAPGAPDGTIEDIGGTSRVAWALATINEGGRRDFGRIYRIEPDLRTSEYFDAPEDSGPAGIGGTEAVIWYADRRYKWIHRINPATGLSEQQWRPPDYATRTVGSIGGNEDVVYYCSRGGTPNASTLYRLDPNDDMRILAQYSYSRASITGIGG